MMRPYKYHIYIRGVVYRINTADKIKIREMERGTIKINIKTLRQNVTPGAERQRERVCALFINKHNRRQILKLLLKF